MKEYKYKINGNLYKVSVGEIEKNIAHVEVNGTVYNVEMEEAAPVKVSAPKPSSAPRTATGEPVISKPTSVSSGADAVKSPLPRSDSLFVGIHDFRIFSIDENCRFLA